MCKGVFFIRGRPIFFLEIGEGAEIFASGADSRTKGTFILPLILWLSVPVVDRTKKRADDFNSAPYAPTLELFHHYINSSETYVPAIFNHQWHMPLAVHASDNKCIVRMFLAGYKILFYFVLTFHSQEHNFNHNREKLHSRYLPEKILFSQQKR